MIWTTFFNISYVSGISPFTFTIDINYFLLLSFDNSLKISR